MSTQLEAELVRALEQRAAAVSPDAVDRLLAVDYRPRTARIGMPLKLTAVTGAATAGAVASVALVGGAQPAFAGWSPTPTAAGGSSPAAQAACEDQMSRLPNAPGEADPTGWRAVVTDVRGPYSVVVLQGAGGFASCFGGPGFASVRRTTTGGSGVSVQGVASGGGPGSGQISVGEARPGPGEIQALSVSHLVQPDQGGYTLVEGQVPSDVSAVTLVRDDGTDVTATVGQGWFVAWWPGTEGVVSARITGATGSSTEALDLPRGGPPNGSSSGAGPAGTGQQGHLSGP